MIGSAHTDFQIIALVLALIGQSCFLWLYLRVHWYVNYIGRALMNGEVTLWLSLVGSLFATIWAKPPFLYSWVDPLLTFIAWTLMISVMFKWRAIWRQQHEPNGRPS